MPPEPQNPVEQRTYVFVENIGELVDGGGYLEALPQNLGLPLEADVLGPLDKPGEVALGLDVKAWSQDAWIHTWFRFHVVEREAETAREGGTKGGTPPSFRAAQDGHVTISAKTTTSGHPPGSSAREFAARFRRASDPSHTGGAPPHGEPRELANPASSAVSEKPRPVVPPPPPPSFSLPLSSRERDRTTPSLRAFLGLGLMSGFTGFAFFAAPFAGNGAAATFLPDFLTGGCTGERRAVAWREQRTGPGDVCSRPGKSEGVLGNVSPGPRRARRSRGKRARKKAAGTAAGAAGGARGNAAGMGWDGNGTGWDGDGEGRGCG
ncbi:MAG: hypothetical protein BJ554DRAFT_6930 [Olpidium bornovanus]|uniref:Uncharacterized protein n=1 Tax=Olpidium bornovanus TaxID=278681 RepID=A0A8H8A227_9FUNG|nr:MAG: hypothetical protein BJ554DRAFT_6930 [Olpidium bornovanus]